MKLFSPRLLLAFCEVHLLAWWIDFYAPFFQISFLLMFPEVLFLYLFAWHGSVPCTHRSWLCQHSKGGRA